jgi:hypothetical protein
MVHPRPLLSDAGSGPRVKPPVQLPEFAAHVCSPPRFWGFDGNLGQGLVRLEQFGLPSSLGLTPRSPMQLNCDPFARPSPPQWLVSNGSVTVGPVRTELLLRGVMHGRVPSDSMVREVGWQSWREIGQIREVCALKRVLERTVAEPSSKAPSLRESAAAVGEAVDVGEALLLALHAAARATSATIGLAHRVREPLLLPTTSCVFEASPQSLGEVLPWFDPVFALARTGGLVLGPANAGVVERAISLRLAHAGSLRGVAMLPISVDGQLCALLELGRSDHLFRVSDAAELADFAVSVGAALTRLSRPRAISNPK